MTFDRSSIAPSGRALAVLAAGLVLALLPTLVSAGLWPLWLAFCGLWIVACGADAALCPRPGRLTVEAELPPILPMGTTRDAVFRLALPVPWKVAAEGLLDLGEGLETAERFVLRLGAEPVRHAVALRPRRRGRAAIEALWLRYYGPLGMVRRAARWRLDATVRAVPDMGFVRAEALRFWNVRNTWSGQKIERFLGDGSEFHALREFVTGLDPRSVDWKASARHTRLLAREYRAENNHQVVVALDTGRLMAEPVEGAPLVDHAIHAALLLASVSLRQGDRVSLFAFDERPHTWSPPRGGPGALPALVELTSGLDYGRAESNFTLALTELMQRLSRRSLVVVLTDFVDSVTAELMVENLLRLRRRHLVVFVALADPFFEHRMEREPRSLSDLQQAVVADTLRQEREIVIRRLAKAGLAVIDTAPRQVGPALLNRYLEIKRREMI